MLAVPPLQAVKQLAKLPVAVGMRSMISIITRTTDFFILMTETVVLFLCSMIRLEWTKHREILLCMQVIQQDVTECTVTYNIPVEIPLEFPCA